MTCPRSHSQPEAEPGFHLGSWMWRGSRHCTVPPLAVLFRVTAAAPAQCVRADETVTLIGFAAFLNGKRSVYIYILQIFVCELMLLCFPGFTFVRVARDGALGVEMKPSPGSMPHLPGAVVPLARSPTCHCRESSWIPPIPRGPREMPENRNAVQRHRTCSQWGAAAEWL